jgi:FlaA1/EpsC-like NDP-sugar epimerase
MSYKARMFLFVFLDSIIVLFSIYLSHFFLNPFTAMVDKTVVLTSVVLLLTHHIFSYILSLYNRAWRYAGIDEMIDIAKVVTASIGLAAVFQLVTFHELFERSLFVTWLLHIVFLSIARYFRVIFEKLFHDTNLQLEKKNKRARRTLIVGAGSAGRMISRQLLNNERKELFPVAFVDDDQNVQKLKINGIPVVGTLKDIGRVSKEYGIEHIIIAIPSLERQKLNEVITESKKVVKDVQILPKLEDLVTGKISIKNVRDVSIEDLLGRDPVDLNVSSIETKVKGKAVLVTGAGGSIGSEICRQLCQFSPSKLVLLGHGEYSIYTIEKELTSTFKDTNIEFITEIADIQDRDKIFKIVKNYKPYIIFHAAAHKHVPLMENNPEEAVKNNVFGTKNVADAAHEFGVNTFVLVSTDKAVNPTSVMGATKRISEMIIQDLNRRSKTTFVAVRFGNVLGSRGSVIPLFKEQINSGGPVTVTHPDMERYFMTIPEASKLVIQAGALAKGGEVFVLDMGEPVKIVDLAKNLIRLSGFSEDEIKIEFTGIRPGEKLYEELLHENEIHNEQIHPKIYLGKSEVYDTSFIVELLRDADSFDKQALREILLDIARNGVPSNEAIKKKSKKLKVLST